MKNNEKIVAVVLTWNDHSMTNRCLESIYEQNCTYQRVIVVDNGSRPPVADRIRAVHPTVEILELDKNCGFTGGCNRGLERALDLGADHVFLLNNDTYVKQGCVRELVEALQTDPARGMASALLISPGDPPKVDFFRSELQRGRARHERLNEGTYPGEQHRHVVETDFAPACAVMFRADMLREIGLFDEALFTNWEDYDLCCRIQDAGYKIVTVGTAEVIHDHGMTTGKISPFITYFYTRNRLICLFRHASKRDVLRNALFILRSYKWQISGQGWTNWPAYAAMLKGMWDFVLGRRGGERAPVKRSD